MNDLSHDCFRLFYPEQFYYIPQMNALCVTRNNNVKKEEKMCIKMQFYIFFSYCIWMPEPAYAKQANAGPS